MDRAEADPYCDAVVTIADGSIESIKVCFLFGHRFADESEHLTKIPRGHRGLIHSPCLNESRRLRRS